MITHLLTCGIALAGVAVFHGLGLPLPWLLGPIFACLAAALTGVRLNTVKPVGNAMRTVLGVAVGLSITPALFSQIGTLIWSIALVPVYLLVIGLVGVPFLRRLGFDKATAYYGAMPGGLQDMLAFGEEAGGDVRAMSLMHATRVLVIVSILPLILTLGLGETLDQPIGLPAAELPIWEMILMIAAGIGGWALFRALGFFGASILGPMAVATALSLTGIVTHRPPTEAILLAQFFIGLNVGAKYVGITIAELRRIVAASVGYCLLLAIIALVFAEIVYQAGLLPLIEAMLAFAPGGQAEMAILALVVGADAAIVVVHHVVRMVVVIVGAPLVSRLLG
ncbi:AbrB family transcriptional regulator [Pseudaestuariivita rosea]|uniref:AbrB family transcriptional regulator n=1 Tax=Pseudaestuariivita rosea TaxID=2763263 RepID=UPI001ABA250D|nr:AbrB family transcriptional regulator [Pseudaestuariivita rosea]